VTQVDINLFFDEFEPIFFIQPFELNAILVSMSIDLDNLAL